MGKFGSVKSAKQITSWSYSRYSVYKECPAKAKYKFIDKLPEPPSQAMERGISIHKMAEDYASGSITTLPKELKFFKDEFKELRASSPMVEDTWAFTKDWNETKWNDWQGCAVRIKTDAYCLDEDTLYVIDHKTGKMRDGYDEQLSLYGLGAMLKFPHIQNVSTQLWFLDSGDQVIKEYSIDQMNILLDGWNKKVAPMLNDVRFPPKPSNACRWCAFSKSKGGPCKY